MGLGWKIHHASSRVYTFENFSTHTTVKNSSLYIKCTSNIQTKQGDDVLSPILHAAVATRQLEIPNISVCELSQIDCTVQMTGVCL